MRRIEKITGRNDDMIILRGVNLFPTQIEELVLGIEQLTPHFILELTRRGTMDDMTVRIERHPDLPVETCEAATVVLAERIKQFVGSTVSVQLVEPGTLPRSEGKYKRVYDLRNQ
jgi:phenylacetate-CoA ligase